MGLDRCLVVGGHQKWQAKMKQRMPELRFIDADVGGISEQALRGAGFIAINTKYISHRLTSAISSIAKRTTKEIIYLNNNNVDIAVGVISAVMRKKVAG